MDKYLIISPKNGGDFIETEDKKAPFIVYNFEILGDWGSNTFDYKLRFSKFDDNVKKIIKEHPNLFDIDSYECALEDASDAKVSRGKVFFRWRKGSPDVWKNNNKIKIELLSSKKNTTDNGDRTSAYCKHTEEKQEVKNDSINSSHTSNSEILSGGKYISENVVEWGVDEIKESLAELKSKEKTDTSEKKSNSNKILGEEKETKVPDSKEDKVLSLDYSQYLMPGREDEPFFYEGSTSDASGATFKIEYERSSMKGLYSLIVDMNNLRTINPGFRREVIKIENNGTTIREASAFTMVSKGEAHFSKEDRVWIVDKPLVIKLLK